MSALTPIDLSRLPPPELVEELSYETILAALLADFKARHPEAVLLDSAIPVKILQTAAYREMLLRQDINERARQCLLATSTGNNLEHLAAFYGVPRAVLDPGNPNASPPVPPTLEDDTSLRRRTQLAPEALSVAGPEGAYVFHALSAGRAVKEMDVTTPAPDTVVVTWTLDPDPVGALALDATAVSPQPGDVRVTVLSREGDGTASPELLEAVDRALNDRFVRPLTDRVRVQGAKIIPYTVEAVIEIAPGPDPDVVRDQARQALSAYARSVHRLGGTVARSGIDGALHVPGVVRVLLPEPQADLLCSPFEAPVLTDVRLEVRPVRAERNGRARS